jgi:hypothetical protein
MAHRPSPRPLRRQWYYPRRRTQRITRRHRHRSGFEKRGDGRGPARPARRSVRPDGADVTKESTIQRNVVRLIIARGGHAIVTRPPGVPAGTPDVVGVYRGQLHRDRDQEARRHRRQRYPVGAGAPLAARRGPLDRDPHNGGCSDDVGRDRRRDRGGAVKAANRWTTCRPHGCSVVVRYGELVGDLECLDSCPQDARRST